MEPVLFIVFNRPEKTKKVLDQIAAYKPERLYISADGPRDYVEADTLKCSQVKNIVTEGINWPCQLFTLYNKKNKGCREAVSSAISWFFQEEECGIILEDDCLPDISFFYYCAELLGKYKNDERIFSIAGSNFGYISSNQQSYIVSRYMNMWGWATWRRSAAQIDYELSEWKSWTNYLKYKFLIKNLSRRHNDFDWGWINYWKNIFDKIAAREIDTWDYQWFFFQFKSIAITLVPGINLIQNIGFDTEATHTMNKEDGLHEPAHAIIFPLLHPDNLKVDKTFEEDFVKKRWAFYKRLSLLWHAKHSVYKLLRSQK